LPPAMPPNLRIRIPTYEPSADVPLSPAQRIKESRQGGQQCSSSLVDRDESLTLSPSHAGNSIPLSPAQKFKACRGVQAETWTKHQYTKIHKETGEQLPVFTNEEVAQHNAEGSCWVTAHGKVYDLTSYMSSHPGGKKAILMHGGGEASTDFEFHSKIAKASWKRYLIGTVEGVTKPQCTVS